MNFGRKTIWLLLIFTAFVLLIVLASWSGSDNEPEYQGIKLSSWADAVEAKNWTETLRLTNGSTEAINAIGTNALPWAMRWLHDAARDKADNIKEEVIEKVNQSQGWFHFELSDSRPLRRKIRALAIFVALGTNANQAIPELERLLKSSDPYVIEYAATAMGYIGSSTVPALVRSINSTNRLTAESSVSILAGMGTNALSAAPVLMDYLKKDSAGLGDTCAHALSQIVPDSKEFQLTMIARFKQSVPNPSWITCSVIKRLGTNVSELSPFVEELIESSADNGWLRRRLIDILSGLDAEKARPYIKELEEKMNDNQNGFTPYVLQDPGVSNAIFLRYGLPVPTTNSHSSSLTN